MATPLNEAREYIDQWQKFVTEQRTLEQSVSNRLADATEKLENDRKLLGLTEQARDILVSASAATQDQVREFIEEVVSLALQSVFGAEYYFALEFKQQRGQSEISPVIMWRQQKFDPRADVGGGIVDVASFALRLVLWVLSDDETSPVFILDEPFKFVSKDKSDEVANMLKGISDLLGIQVIMISHDEGLIVTADRSWEVRMGSDGTAEVEQLN
jgi:DNA repair exonuclease SbcCD ATPase subunit